jgi:hypothetical protein
LLWLGTSRSIFENLIVSEIQKSRLHRGLKPDLFFYRDQSGREVDLLDDVERVPWRQVHQILA